jgi:hypothetical protein
MKGMATAKNSNEGLPSRCEPSSGPQSASGRDRPATIDRLRTYRGAFNFKQGRLER